MKTTVPIKHECLKINKVVSSLGSKSSVFKLFIMAKCSPTKLVRPDFGKEIEKSFQCSGISGHVYHKATEILEKVQNDSSHNQLAMVRGKWIHLVDFLPLFPRDTTS